MRNLLVALCAIFKTYHKYQPPPSQHKNWTNSKDQDFNSFSRPLIKWHLTDVLTVSQKDHREGIVKRCRNISKFPYGMLRILKFCLNCSRSRNPALTHYKVKRDFKLWKNASYRGAFNTRIFFLNTFQIEDLQNTWRTFIFCEL